MVRCCTVRAAPVLKAWLVRRWQQGSAAAAHRCLRARACFRVRREEMDPERRPLPFMPTKYKTLRHVPLYHPLIKERFNRCLDLCVGVGVELSARPISPSVNRCAGICARALSSAGCRLTRRPCCRSCRRPRSCVRTQRRRRSSTTATPAACVL